MKKSATVSWHVVFLAALMIISGLGVSLAADKDKPQKTTLGDLPCFASEIAKFNGMDWSCSKDQTHGDGSPVLVLLDANGNPVGDLIDFGSGERAPGWDWPSYLMRGASMINFLYSFEDQAGNSRRTILSIGPLSPRPHPWTTVFFESSDCSGSYLSSLFYTMGDEPLGDPLPPRTGYDLGLSLSHAVLAVTQLGVSPVDLYVLDWPTARVYQKNSQLTCVPNNGPPWNCFCDTGPFGSPTEYGARMELAVPDFLSAHPLPYALEVE